MSSVIEKNRKVSIYYFSGTGNTQVVAHTITETFEKVDFTVNCRPIEQCTEISVAESAMVGIGFPIASFSSYPLVLDFLHRLPAADGTAVFCFVTMGGAHLCGIIDEVCRLMETKGYRPVGFCSFIMPPNLFLKIPEGMRRRRMERARIKAVQFTEKLVHGKGRWKRMFAGSRAVFLLFNAIFGLARHRWHQKLLKMKVDAGRCTRCGICMNKCPVGNITLGENVVVNDACQYCFRCAAVCPANAIAGILSPRSLHYRAEGAKF